MDQALRFDPRIAPYTQSANDLSGPQAIFYRNAKTARTGHVAGVVDLHRMADIVAINRHTAVTGMVGRGGSVGNDSTLSSLKIDSGEQESRRRLQYPMSAPKQVVRVADCLRSLAVDHIGGFRKLTYLPTAFRPRSGASAWASFSTASKL